MNLHPIFMTFLATVVPMAGPKDRRRSISPLKWSPYPFPGIESAHTRKPVLKPFLTRCLHYFSIFDKGNRRGRSEWTPSLITPEVVINYTKTPSMAMNLQNFPKTTMKPLTKIWGFQNPTPAATTEAREVQKTSSRTKPSPCLLSIFSRSGQIEEI